MGLAETQIAERPLHGIDAARYDHVAAMALEFEHGLIDGCQRGSARRIGGVVHAAEIETIGGAPRRNVQKNSGKAILGPLRQPLGRLWRKRTEKAGHLGADGILRTNIANAAAGSQNDRCPLVNFGGIFQSGVRQASPHDFQRHELKRIDSLHRARRDTVAQRIKQKIVQETTPARVDMVRRGAVLVEVKPPVPALSRDFNGAFELVENVVPKFLDAVGFWKDAGKSDDRDIGGPRLAAIERRHGARLRQAGPPKAHANSMLTERCNSATVLTSRRRVAT